MGWTFALDGVELAEEDLTAGELEHLFLLVNSEISHPEASIGAGPFGHCPVCRVAIGVVALEGKGIPTDVAVLTVRELAATELAEAFIDPEILRAVSEAS